MNLETNLGDFAPLLEKINWTWWQITIFVCLVIYFATRPAMAKHRNAKLEIKSRYAAIEAKADRDMERFMAKSASKHAKRLAKQKKGGSHEHID